MPVNSRSSVVALTTSVSLAIAIFFTLYSLIPVTRVDEPGLGSLYVGTMMAFVMGVQVFTPALVRRLSLRYTLAGAIAVFSVGALVTGWADGTVLLLAGAVAAGAGFGTIVVAGALGVALLVTPDRLGRSLGTYGLVTMAASAVGSPVGLQVALTYSPQVFGVCAVILGAVAIAMTSGIPAAVGTGHGRLGESESSTSTGDRSGGARGLPALAAGAPWLVLALLLMSIILLSHGLTSLPVTASAFGSAAVVVFAAQAGNAVGRGIGGELEARILTRATVLTGVLLLTAGGAIGVLVTGIVAAMTSGVLIGLGVGIVQNVALHTAMRRMDAGRASVVWNLAVDGGLWAGGILWGLALTAGLVGAGSLAFSAAVLVIGITVAVRADGTGRPGTS